MEQRYGKDVADINMRIQCGDPVCRHWCASNPKVTQVLWRARQAYMLNGQLKESQEVLTRLFNLFPRNVAGHHPLTETLMRSGENKRARSCLDDLFNVVETDA